jgi:hypothetical protein
MSAFVRLRLYISAETAGAGTVAAQGLVDLMRSIAGVTLNLGSICFGFGTLLFFYLFFKSRYIPRALSVLGLAASLIFATLYFARLVFPEQQALFQYICFPPMGLADVTTGFYLMLFAAKTGVRGNQPVQRAAIPA